jgi:hypothetical protein
MTCPGCGMKVEPRLRTAAPFTLLDAASRLWHHACVEVFLGSHNLRIADLRAECNAAPMISYSEAVEHLQMRRRT